MSGNIQFIPVTTWLLTQVKKKDVQFLEMLSYFDCIDNMHI